MDIFNIRKRLNELKEMKAYEAKCKTYRNNEWKREQDSRKYWTPELIEFVGQTNDPVKLAVASCLINTHAWPEWIPSKPKEYNEKGNNVMLYLSVDLYKILKVKSELMSPGLYQKIWDTKYYRTYKPIYDLQPNKS